MEPESSDDSSSLEEAFKMPMLPGSGSKPPPSQVLDPPAEQTLVADNSPLPAAASYTEPSWSGLPPPGYTLEMLKSGSIVESVKLCGRSAFVVGRMTDCQVRLEHPSLSRYHAVIQYKEQGSPEKPPGFYLYDLDSTHGTYHNKQKCFPKTYYRVRVGHNIKFGGSTRLVILQGPEEDMEAESDLSMTELIQRTRQKAELNKLKEKEEDEEEKPEDESQGISWGMADDAEEEEPEIGHKNPFALEAEPMNESLYLDDPKKTLRGWFEREGLDLEYECKEKGYATFHCTVSLPLEEGTVVAEATVKGKKKEAVVQCALEACRLLDRKGVLRQSNQESRAKKVLKKLEDDDFYGSDEDEFLDRTGNIEQKRKVRMKMAGKAEAQEVETFESLQKKSESVRAELALAESQLQQAQASVKRKSNADMDEEEDLDEYMKRLGGAEGAALDKAGVAKLKQQVAALQKEAARLTRLVAIAKPAQMPELVPAHAATEDNTGPKKFAGVMVGKRGGGRAFAQIRTLKVPDKVVVASPVESGTTHDDKTPSAESKPSAIEREEAKSLPEIVKVQKEIPVPEAPKKPVLVEAEPRLSPVLPRSEDEGGPKRPSKAAVASPSPAPLRVETPRDDASEAKKKSRGRKRAFPDISTEYSNSGADPKYDTWVPPANQTGDGRTSLNDKLGY